MPTKSKSRDITLTRIYDAPVKAVWDAWTDPKKAAKWWGPRGFTITTHSKDLKPGGHWHYTMHGPDGTDYPNWTVYLEVDQFKRLVYDHGGYEDRPPLFRVTVMFKETGKKTQMEMTMTCPTPEEAEQTKKFIKSAGGNSTWDRLAEYLEQTQTEKEIFVINRSFEAPIETMFEMWSDPKHLSRWLAPTGVRMETIEGDIGEGRTMFYKMTNDKDVTMFGKIHYLKIDRPNALQYTQMFCDDKGQPSRHPFAPTWPRTMLTRITFTPEAEGQTRVTVTWSPYGEVTAEELQTFITMKSGMTQGWTGSFDKLEEYLESRK